MKKKIKKEICSICKRKYVADEDTCFMCHSTKGTQCLHEWIETTCFGKYFLVGTLCTVVLTSSESVQ